MNQDNNKENTSENQEEIISKDSLYLKIGGDGSISDLIDQFYYKVLFDKTLRGKFLKADMNRVRLQQKTFFAQMFGCPHAKYEGKDIYEVHKFLGITADQFNTFAKHLEHILIDMQKPRELIDEILSMVEKQRGNIVISQ